MVASAGYPLLAHAQNVTSTDPIRKYLEGAVVSRETIDKFLDPDVPKWARFDPDVGYIMNSSIMRDGMDGALTLSNYSEQGYRKLINFADRPCRINTYGNSFTQCHQVSNGETWQEILAAHFGEPIRNFGVGGHGVYQAYLRFKRAEITDLSARYVILNIWGDDHRRSIQSFRYLTHYKHWKAPPGAFMYHSNPWKHLRFDLDTGRILEAPNPCPTPESMYQLCDKSFLYERFKDDLVTQILVCQQGESVDTSNLEKFAGAMNLKLDFKDPANRAASATTLYNECGWRASMYIIKKLKTFVETHNKKLLVLLSYPGPSVMQACELADRNNPAYMDWHPKKFRDFLSEQNILFFDSLNTHLDEFRTFRLTPQEYIQRYYIGHYNPKGNHFFAYALKNVLVNWLNPKPPTYRAYEDIIRFEGYLPDA